MKIDSIADILTFFISLATGTFLAVVYILFKAYRKVFKSSVLGVVFQDILFSIILAITTFTLLFLRVYGEIRWFVLVPEFIGFVLIKVFIEKYIIKIFFLIFKKIKIIIMFINTVFKKLNLFLNGIFDEIIIKFQKRS